MPVGKLSIALSIEIRWTIEFILRENQKVFKNT